MSRIENERELRYTYETLTKMYNLRDRIEAEPTGNPELRKEEAISIEMMIHKIERQIAAYLTAREQQAAEMSEQQAAELREQEAEEPLVKAG
jgi:hypothetical protein